MNRKLLKSKIHRATITHADIEYEGSITISPELMEKADLVPHEAVAVWNVTSGTRLETYVIPGIKGTSDIAINGAAAHLMKPGDLIIVASFAEYSEDEVSSHVPKKIFVDAKNRFVYEGDEVPGPEKRDRERDIKKALLI